jgi:lipopolysaccharide/colanic/teichoic acid biosynthesis glycosyltransferase
VSAAPTGSVNDQDLLIFQEKLFEVAGAIPPVSRTERNFPVSSWRYRYFKRVFDFFCAIIMIALLSVPSALIALAIFLTSPGPVFYRELRIGRNGRPFRIWKFRSMHQDAHRNSHIFDAAGSGKYVEWRMRKHLSDPRVTPIGGFLRRWSLDELPQLINVLCGDMSLIGPRPIVEKETRYYGSFMDHYLAVYPGMSGLWQVSGRSHVDYDKRVLMDAFYVESWSLNSDFNILFRTLPAVLSRRGAV